MSITAPDALNLATGSQALRPGYNEPMRLLAAISSLRNDNKYTDLEIHCQGKVFKVHKAIVCKQVDFFAACVDGDFQESHTGVIELKEDLPEIVKYFIDFLYTEDYQVKKQGTTKNSSGENMQKKDELHIQSQTDAEINAFEPPVDFDSSELLVHSYVYTIADKYVVENLQKLANGKFQLAISKSGEKDLSTFTSVLKSVFEGSSETDRTLRDPCIQFAQKWSRSLTQREEFRNFLKANGDICLEILDDLNVSTRLAIESAKKSTRSCQQCNNHKCPSPTLQVVSEVPGCPDCDDHNDVRMSSANDVARFGGQFYCVHCRLNFNVMRL